VYECRIRTLFRPVSTHPKECLSERSHLILISSHLKLIQTTTTFGKTSLRPGNPLLPLLKHVSSRPPRSLSRSSVGIFYLPAFEVHVALQKLQVTGARESLASSPATRLSGPVPVSQVFKRTVAKFLVTPTSMHHNLLTNCDSRLYMLD